jgi:hypothetical protein
MRFGLKGKKLSHFGRKVAKAGLFGLKTGGKIAGIAGTMMGQPSLMAAGSAASAIADGIEKM